MRPRTVWQFAGCLTLAAGVVTGVSAQSRGTEPAEPVREQQAEPGVRNPPKDAAEHLARVEEIVREALDDRRDGEPPDQPEPIGTAGTPMTMQTGEIVTIERARLEEIQLHLEQIRTALAARPR